MRPSRGFGLLILLVFAGDLPAGSLEVIVKDDKGRPCSDAVAYAAVGGASATSKIRAVIDQRDKQFIPYVTAVKRAQQLFSRTAITFDITFIRFRPRKNSSCRFTAAFPRNR